MSESINADAPDEPIEFSLRLSVVRLEFVLRESLNDTAPDEPIEFL